MWWIIKNVNCTQHKTQETAGEKLGEIAVRRCLNIN